MNYMSSSFLDWYFPLVFSLYMWPCYFSQCRPVDYRNPALAVSDRAALLFLTDLTCR
jgi:hypothetical protein